MLAVTSSSENWSAQLKVWFPFLAIFSLASNPQNHRQLPSLHPEFCWSIKLAKSSIPNIYLTYCTAFRCLLLISTRKSRTSLLRSPLQVTTRSRFSNLRKEKHLWYCLTRLRVDKPTTTSKELPEPKHLKRPELEIRYPIQENITRAPTPMCTRHSTLIKFSLVLRNGIDSPVSI